LREYANVCSFLQKYVSFSIWKNTKYLVPACKIFAVLTAQEWLQNQKENGWSVFVALQ